MINLRVNILAIVFAFFSFFHESALSEEVGYLGKIVLLLASDDEFFTARKIEEAVGAKLERHERRLPSGEGDSYLTALLKGPPASRIILDRSYFAIVFPGNEISPGAEPSEGSENCVCESALNSLIGDRFERIYDYRTPQSQNRVYKNKIARLDVFYSNATGCAKEIRAFKL